MSHLQLALKSLKGLSVGDAFGASIQKLPTFPTTDQNLSKEQWRWTDDTHMALSIVETLKTWGHINPDVLTSCFTERYRNDPARGYGPGAAELLRNLCTGAQWRQETTALFGGGSFGNGAAMRAAPIGAYFKDQLSRVALEAQLSAIVTHAHPEGQAGAMAVALAAAIAYGDPSLVGKTFLSVILERVPPGLVYAGIKSSLDIQKDDFQKAIETLGVGYKTSAQDTVPFCVWVAAHNLNSYEQALWKTAKVLGDIDTNCAIVGGILGTRESNSIPKIWLDRVEPLDDEFNLS